MSAATKERFLSMLVPSGNGCMEHPGSLGSHGYPQFGDPRKSPWKGTAHRAEWTEHQLSKLYDPGSSPGGRGAPAGRKVG